MPVKPLRAKVRRNDLDPNILTQQRYENLTSQMAVILDGDIFPSQEDRKKCYRVNKKEIMERWFSDQDNFCERPYAWWQFESLPQREIIGEQRWWNSTEWKISRVEEKDHQFLFRCKLLLAIEMDRYHELESWRIPKGDLPESRTSGESALKS